MSFPAMTEINSWDEVPRFANETEEHDYWATHCLGDALLPTFTRRGDPRLPEPRAEAPDVPVSLTRETIQRLHELALRKGSTYQSLAREFIAQRLAEEEQQKGVIP